MARDEARDEAIVCGSRWSVDDCNKYSRRPQQGARSVASLVFGGLLLLVMAAYFWTRTSRTVLFWAAFIITRPLGAVVGDFLDKPLDAGGLALSRYSACAAIVAIIVFFIFVFPQRAAKASAH